MRLKTEIIIAAEMKRATGLGLYATVINKGDASAGQIYIIIFSNNQQFLLFGPPFGTSFDEQGNKLWRYTLGDQPIDAHEVSNYLEKVRSFDQDIYVLEVEDKSLEFRPTGIFIEDNEPKQTVLLQEAEQFFK